MMVVFDPSFGDWIAIIVVASVLANMEPLVVIQNGQWGDGYE